MRQSQVIHPQFFRCGPYCEGAHYETASGKRHFLPTLHYHDVLAEDDKGRPLRRTAWFRPILLALPQTRKGQMPYFHAQVAGKGEFPIPLKKGDERWRKLVFEVSPNQVRPKWFASPDDDKGRAFPAASHEGYRKAFAAIHNPPGLKNPPAHLKELPSEPLAFRTHGFVIACGKCTIRRLALVPKPPEPGKE
jgi:hypothetical protein